MQEQRSSSETRHDSSEAPRPQSADASLGHPDKNGRSSSSHQFLSESSGGNSPSRKDRSLLDRLHIRSSSDGNVNRGRQDERSIFLTAPDGKHSPLHSSSHDSPPPWGKPDTTRSSSRSTDRSRSGSRSTLERLHLAYSKDDTSLNDLSYERLGKQPLDEQIYKLKKLSKEMKGLEQKSAIARSWQRQENALDKGDAITRRLSSELTSSSSLIEGREIWQKLFEEKERVGREGQVSDSPPQAPDSPPSVKITDSSYWTHMPVESIGAYWPGFTKSINDTISGLSELTKSINDTVSDFSAQAFSALSIDDIERSVSQAQAREARQRKESALSASGEALSKQLVELRTGATAIEENFKDWQVKARVDFARLTGWVGAAYAGIDQVEHAHTSLKRGGNLVDNAASTQLATVKGELDKLAFPELQKFNVNTDNTLEAPSFEQIMAEKSILRSNTMNSTKTLDSLQEEKNRILSVENVDAMKKAIDQNISDMKSSGSRVDAKKIELTGLMSELVNEPIAHLKTLESLKEFGDLGKLLDKAKDVAQTREKELEIIARGRTFVSDAYEKVWESNHPAVQGLRHTDEEIRAQIKIAESSINGENTFESEKLYAAIEKHKNFSRDFIKQVEKRLNAMQDIFSQKEIEEIALTKAGLTPAEFRATYGPGNVAQTFATKVVDGLLNKAVDAIPVPGI